METVKIRFTKRHLVRKYGAKPVDLPKSGASRFIKNGDAILVETEFDKEEKASSGSSESSMSSSSSESSRSSPYSTEEEIENSGKPESKVKVKIKKK